MRQQGISKVKRKVVPQIISGRISILTCGFFSQNRPPVRYRDCVLAYRHIYSRDRPERQKRDHDNIETNMVSDIVALYVMPDDGPDICSHYSCGAEGVEERTEVYVILKKEFPDWLLKEPNMPEEECCCMKMRRFDRKNI